MKEFRRAASARGTFFERNGASRRYFAREIPPVSQSGHPDTLAARVFEAGCEAYPDAIRLFADGGLKIEKGQLRIG